jgi:cysteine desulfurase
VAAVTRAAGVPLHVDAVGAIGRLPLNVENDRIDLLTLGANDLYGPPGVGALWIRRGVQLLPQVLGGGQEEGLRSGTENLAGGVGLGVAAEVMLRDGAAEANRLRGLRDRLLDGLDALRPVAHVSGPRHDRLPHHASATVDGVKGESLILALDIEGISVSSGSACAARTGEPSQVLQALGGGRRAAEGSLCFTLGRWTTPEDIDAVLGALPAIVDRLRAASPLT